MKKILFVLIGGSVLIFFGAIGSLSSIKNDQFSSPQVLGSSIKNSIVVTTEPVKTTTLIPTRIITITPVITTKIVITTPVPVKTTTPISQPTQEQIIQPRTYNPCTSGATAICGDGSLSYSAHRQGTCSHHGGVARWC